LNKHLLPQLILVLVAVMLLASLPALAGPPITFHASVKGGFAEAYFDSTDRSGCVESFVYIFAQKAIDKETGQPEQGPQASALIQQNDICNGALLMYGIGTATLTEASFQIDKKFSSARLDATLEFCDSVSDTCFPVDAHLIWTSSGSPYRLKEHRQIQAAGLKINSRYDGTFRQGTASGTITDGTRNLSPESAFSVNLASVKFGEIDLLY
jgi:hypothetical protein